MIHPGQRIYQCTGSPFETGGGRQQLPPVGRTQHPASLLSFRLIGRSFCWDEGTLTAALVSASAFDFFQALGMAVMNKVCSICDIFEYLCLSINIFEYKLCSLEVQ